jgi:hypothetical protein
MSEIETERCPYCGNPEIDAAEVLCTRSNGSKQIATGCGECGAQGPYVDFVADEVAEYSPSFDCKTSAADKWNLVANRSNFLAKEWLNAK